MHGQEKWGYFSVQLSSDRMACVHRVVKTPVEKLRCVAQPFFKTFLVFFLSPLIRTLCFLRLPYFQTTLFSAYFIIYRLIYRSDMRMPKRMPDSVGINTLPRTNTNY